LTPLMNVQGCCAVAICVTSFAGSAGADPGDDSRFPQKQACSKMADMPL
jgi:hypothetical protein